MILGSSSDEVASTAVELNSYSLASRYFLGTSYRLDTSPASVSGRSVQGSTRI